MPPDANDGSALRSRWRAAIVVVALLAAAAVAAGAVRERSLDARLLRSDPAAIAADASLTSHAETLAARAYAGHCVACHGREGGAPTVPGAPSLFDANWLFSADPVELEQTILYGIRSGHPRARNITDMPAVGRTGQLSDDEIRDVVAFVRSLSTPAGDTAAVARGRELYLGKGNCFDCHASDARGTSDYGAPALYAGALLYGGDEASLLVSVRDGRHGLCPAWHATLRAAEIRALAVWLNRRSSRP